MRGSSDRHQVSTVSAPQPSQQRLKRLGGYLVEAGLLTVDQVKVALNDQQATGMRFGDVLVARGWVKEQTIEWVMQKVVLPEKRAYQKKQSIITQSQEKTIQQPMPTVPTAPIGQQPLLEQPRISPPSVSGRLLDPMPIPISSSSISTSISTINPPTTPPGVVNRRDIPIAKPLPSVKSPDEDVNWVG